jgi:triphosphoribosyl-dephospho-CoA synthase
MAATWNVAGCNTNLGILLLCAPIAAAVEFRPLPTTRPALRAAIQSVLADLDLDDARAAYRAIAHANPGGLGTSPSEDVRQPPGIDLRSAMALAAPRDSIARQYRDGYADLIEIAPAALGAGFSLMSPAIAGQLQVQTTATVQRLYLTLLSRWPDSHIVRIHGEAVAHTVMAAAQAWLERAGEGCGLDTDPAFAAWDAALKADRINPGTSADLTVATLMIAGLTAPS